MQLQNDEYQSDSIGAVFDQLFDCEAHDRYLQRFRSNFSLWFSFGSIFAYILSIKIRMSPIPKQPYVDKKYKNYSFIFIVGRGTNRV